MYQTYVLIVIVNYYLLLDSIPYVITQNTASHIVKLKSLVLKVNFLRKISSTVLISKATLHLTNNEGNTYQS